MTILYSRLQTFKKQLQTNQRLLNGVGCLFLFLAICKTIHYNNNHGITRSRRALHLAANQHHPEIHGISARAGEVEFFRLSLGKDKHAQDFKKPSA